MIRRVDGAANYRRVPLVAGEQDEGRYVYGTGLVHQQCTECLTDVIVCQVRLGESHAHVMGSWPN